MHMYITIVLMDMNEVGVIPALLHIHYFCAFNVWLLLSFPSIMSAYPYMALCVLHRLYFTLLKDANWLNYFEWLKCKIIFV